MSRTQEPGERYVPRTGDHDPRVTKYVNAAKAGDQRTIQEMIDEAIDTEDWAIMRRFITVNSAAMSQLKHLDECLRISQRESRGWKNVAQGLKIDTGEKIKVGHRQVAEAEAAKEKIGDNYLEFAWK